MNKKIKYKSISWNNVVTLNTLCPQRFIAKIGEDSLKYFWTKIYNLKTYSRNTLTKKWLYQNKNKNLFKKKSLQRKSLLEKISYLGKHGKKTKNWL